MFSQQLKRRALSLAVAVIRRSGLLPKSFPDGLGDDRRLLGKRINAQVVVYFGDTIQGLYQLEPWYCTLRALHQVHRVVVFGTDSRAIRQVRRDSGLPAFTIGQYSTIDDLLSRSPIRLVLYVNHNNANFFMLRFPNLVHVSITHGDSDKVVSISNQTKAYDFTFVPGQAAIDRLEAYLPGFDAPKRCIIVGRPTADVAGGVVEGRGGVVAGGGGEAGGAAGTGATDAATGRGVVGVGGQVGDVDVAGEVNTAGGADIAGAAASGGWAGRWTVLYAPTWEGGVPSAAYSSLKDYGPEIVAALTTDHRFRLIYRPHPLTGVRVAGFGDADLELRRAVQAAAANAPTAGHAVSVGGDAQADLARADFLISDVSALAIDYLATGRPLAVTIPPEPDVVVAATALLDAVPRLGPEQLDGLAGFVAHQLTADPGKAKRQAVTGYYLGDTAPGAATVAFAAACGRMIDLAESNRQAIAAKLAQGAP